MFAAPAHSSAAPRSLRLALGVLATGMLMVVLDGSIVTVAMPVIQSDPGFSPRVSPGSSTPTRALVASVSSRTAEAGPRR